MKSAALLTALMLFFSAASHAAQLDDAIQAYDKGNYVLAVQLLAPLAKNGDAAAQLRLGMLNYYGRGMKENEPTAMELWEKSAAQGNTEAMFQLGKAYTFGSQIAKNIADPDVEAAKWYYKAASAGHAEAQFSLGLMFLVGKGVVEDRAEALRWIRLAADHGQAEARRFLAGSK
jgi:hypothetical protein